jgi:hypothetical protein
MNALPSIFTIEIGDAPMLTFEAQILREAHELCHKQWLRDYPDRNDRGILNRARATPSTR